VEVNCNPPTHPKKYFRPMLEKEEQQDDDQKTEDDEDLKKLYTEHNEAS